MQSGNFNLVDKYFHLQKQDIIKDKVRLEESDLESTACVFLFASTGLCAVAFALEFYCKW